MNSTTPTNHFGPSNTLTAHRIAPINGSAPTGSRTDFSLESRLAGGAAPVFTYHRFWTQADIALAMGSYAELLVQSPPALRVRGPDT
ncbi:glycoside hydrolase family 48 protein [Streptomyces sp. NPDC048251]|uniref:glycoside hydrolase family 48 protein n=1 Tax=Streptomyces sp. NPDC048251 TaxID=3154501 RepID=UPI00343D7187